jgi:Zinc finger, C3HC4 type (RING finger)
MMLQAALTPALNAVVKKDVTGIFAKFGSHGFREQMAKNAEYDRATAKSKESLNVKKCVCLVCNSIAAEPCVAKCGHICCEPCWSQWLGRKQTCPYCRAPTTMQQIKKITIVRN